MLGLWLLLTALAASFVVLVATSGPRDRSGRLEVDRVTYPDVEALLLSGPTPPSLARRTVRAAQEQQLTARTLWRWAAIHGHAGLVAVVEANLAEATLLEHLDAGTQPSWQPPQARFPVVGELGDRRPVPSRPAPATQLDPLELLGFDRLPPISGPGLVP